MIYTYNEMLNKLYDMWDICLNIDKKSDNAICYFLDKKNIRILFMERGESQKNKWSLRVSVNNQKLKFIKHVSFENTYVKNTNR